MELGPRTKILQLYDLGTTDLCYSSFLYYICNIMLA